LLVSIGNGFTISSLPEGAAKKYDSINWARYVVNRLMEDANLQQNRTLKLIGYQPNQFDKLTNKVVFTPKTASNQQQWQDKLLTYYRFTTSFTKDRLIKLQQFNNNIKCNLDLSYLAKMDCVDQKEQLQEIGIAIGKEQFSINRLEGFL
jgi:hypothetical protein